MKAGRGTLGVMGETLGTCDFVRDHPALTGRVSSPIACERPAVVVLTGLVQGRRCLLHATAAGMDFHSAPAPSAPVLAPSAPMTAEAEWTS